jgi:hypothetical protein
MPTTAIDRSRRAPFGDRRAAPVPPIVNSTSIRSRSSVLTISPTSWLPREEPSTVPPISWMRLTRAGVSSRRAWPKRATSPS